MLITIAGTLIVSNCFYPNVIFFRFKWLSAVSVRVPGQAGPLGAGPGRGAHRRPAHLFPVISHPSSTHNIVYILIIMIYI